MSFSRPGPCPTCGQKIDESRGIEMNYLHGEFGKPGGPQDWMSCAGCLSVFRVEWIPQQGIGDDAWQMSAMPEILMTGAAVAVVIERLRESITAGEPARALDELHAAHDAWRLLEIPEVVEAAWPAFGGRAITTTHLGFSGPTIRGLPLLTEQDPMVVERLLREPAVNGLRTSARDGVTLVTGGTKLAVVGSGGARVHVRLSKTPLEVPLERLSLDPDAP